MPERINALQRILGIFMLNSRCYLLTFFEYSEVLMDGLLRIFRNLPGSAGSRLHQARALNALHA
jgi:hypothetical protein